MITWWFLRSTGVDQRWPWKVALVSLLVLGVALRLVEVTYDHFDYDDYHLRMGIEMGFADYAKHFMGTDSLQFVAHYWLSNRLLGSSSIAYHSMSLVAGIALLMLATFWLKRAWPKMEVVVLVVLVILVIGADARYLSRYAMFAYGNTFLLSAALFFLFMRLSEGPLKSRQWLWISAVLPVAAFFSNEFLIVPLAIGSFTVFVLRWMRSGGPRHLAALLGWVWELKPLLIFPIVYAVKQVAFPYIYWGASLRSDQVDLYFPSSGYPTTPVGMVEFLSAKTYTLLRDVLTPGGISDRPAKEAVFIGGCGFLGALALLQVARRRADRRTVFTSIFLLTTLVSIAFGSLLGLYPYGTPRYTPYLFMPSAILIGIGSSILFNRIIEGSGLLRSWNALLAWSGIVALVGGAVFCVAWYLQIAKDNQEDAQAITWVQSRQSDMIFADNYIATVLYTKAPATYPLIHQLGWGTCNLSKQDVVPSELTDAIAHQGQSQQVDTILVVLFPHGLCRNDSYEGFEQRYPNWSKLVEANFGLVESIKSPNVEGLLYRRKLAGISPDSVSARSGQVAQHSP